jgi:multidrug efflux pump subunit AcrA (membrane-fusion protein)
MHTSLSSSRAQRYRPKRIAFLCVAVGVLAALVFAAASHRTWWPQAKQLWAFSANADEEGSPSEDSAAEGAADHAGHSHAGHDHAGHEEAASLELSPQAWKNLDLKVGKVELQDYERTVTIPALVVERPGRTKIQVAAPLTGMVTGVFVAKGQAVNPGDRLFNLRLTHEDLVATQTEFLKTLESLDVENREIARLERITEGAVARKVVLEREYERQKLEGLLRAQREALLLHGLSEDQVQQITQERRLLRELAVYAPAVANHEEEQQFLKNDTAAQVIPAEFAENSSDASHPLVVQNLDVHQGDVVQAGSPLCDLVDLKVLYAEGRGFEQDAQEVIQAANRQWPVQAVFAGRANEPEIVAGLEIVFVANEVEPESRAFHFYVALPNSMIRDVQGPTGARFVAWKYKLGQRLNLLVPVERWAKKIVLPVEAIATEGAEAFVFVQNGDHFDRQPVHVEHRDQRHAVIAHDGSVFPGAYVALSSAHQLQMALKNKAGGGPDPHAGHNH